MPVIDKTTIAAMTVALSGVAAQAQTMEQNGQDGHKIEVVSQQAQTQRNDNKTFDATSFFNRDNSNASLQGEAKKVFNLIGDNRRMSSFDSAKFQEVSRQIEAKYGSNACALVEMALCGNEGVLKELGIHDAVRQNYGNGKGIADLAILGLATAPEIDKATQEKLINDPNRATLNDLANVKSLFFNEIGNGDCTGAAVAFCSKFGNKALKMAETALCLNYELAQEVGYNNNNISRRDFVMSVAASKGPSQKAQERLMAQENTADCKDVMKAASTFLIKIPDKEKKNIGNAYHDMAAAVCGKYGKDAHILIDKALCGDEALLKALGCENADNCIEPLNLLINGRKIKDGTVKDLAATQGASYDDLSKTAGKVLEGLPYEHLSKTDGLTYRLCAKYGKNAPTLAEIAKDNTLLLAQALGINKEKLANLSKDERTLKCLETLTSTKDFNPEKQQKLITQNNVNKQIMAQRIQQAYR